MSSVRPSEWLLLIRDEEGLEFPPELYSRHASAIEGVRQWAWFLSRRSGFETRERAFNRWSVGIHDIHVTSVEGLDRTHDPAPWIGATWARQGYGDVRVAVLESREAAVDWAGAGGISLRAHESIVEPAGFLPDGDTNVAFRPRRVLAD